MLSHDDPCFLTFCNNVVNRISLSYLAEKVKNPPICSPGCDGICKLGDFGLIVDLTNPSQNGWREGDSKYLAPEVLRGVITKVDRYPPHLI